MIPIHRAPRPSRVAWPSSVPMLDRRSFLGLTGASAGLAALTACAGPSTSGSGATASETTSASDWSGVTPASQISFWSNHPGGSNEIENTLVDAFNASQDAVTVSLVTAGSNYEEVAQRFQTALTGGGLPGVVILSDVWWFRYFLNQTIIPLEGILEAVEIDTADFRPSFFADYQHNGSQWAVPYARSTPMFYYNTEHWAAAGLPDRAPQTWEEFAEWGPVLQDSGQVSERAFHYPSVAGYAGWTFQNNVWGWGGAYSQEWDITIDEDPAVRALEWIRQGIHEQGWAGITSNDQAADLASGAISATVSSTGSLVGILNSSSFEVGVGYMPGGPAAASPVCPSGGAGLGIPSGITPEEQLAAATFLKFVTQPENALAFSAATGYIPTRTSADISELVAAAPQIETAINQIEVVRTQDWARTYLPGGDIAIANGVGRVMIEDADPADSLATTRVELEDIFSTDVEPNL